MVRELALKEKNTYVAGQKKAVIAMALGVVTRRYHISRKERRNMVGNELVPPAANGGDNGD